LNATKNVSFSESIIQHPPTNQLIVSRLFDRRNIWCVSFYLAFRLSALL